MGWGGPKGCSMDLRSLLRSRLSAQASCLAGPSMKLDVNALRYLSREEFRTLQAVEVGQKNVRAVQSFSPKADRLA